MYRCRSSNESFKPLLALPLPLPLLLPLLPPPPPPPSSQHGLAQQRAGPWTRLGSLDVTALRRSSRLANSRYRHAAISQALGTESLATALDRRFTLFLTRSHLPHWA